MTLDEIEAARNDTERLHGLLFEALAMPPGAGDTFVSAIRHWLGVWPFPDTPVDEVLTYAGTPGLPVGRVLAAEQSRPARYQRPELIAELRSRADGLGLGAHALQIPRPPTS